MKTRSSFVKNTTNDLKIKEKEWRFEDFNSKQALLTVVEKFIKDKERILSYTDTTRLVEVYDDSDFPDIQKRGKIKIVYME